MKNYCLYCQEEIPDGKTYCLTCQDILAELIEKMLGNRLMSRKAIGLMKILR